MLVISLWTHVCGTDMASTCATCNSTYSHGGPYPLDISTQLVHALQRFINIKKKKKKKKDRD